MKKILLASALCSALTTALPVVAMAQSMKAGDLSMQDKMFIKKAAGAGMAEVADGKLAKAQGGPDVKKIAVRMVTDHEAANEQLMSLSQQLGDPAPAVEDAKDESEHEALSQLSGDQFDTQYLQDQLKAHEKAIALFQKEADDGADPQLKQFASDTLPTLQMHLDMIQKAIDKKGDDNG